MRKSRGLMLSFFRVALSSNVFHLNETRPLLPVPNIVLPALSTCGVLSLCDPSLEVGRHPVLMAATAFNFGMAPYSDMDGAKTQTTTAFSDVSFCPCLRCILERKQRLSMGVLCIHTELGSVGIWGRRKHQSNFAE